MMDTPLTIRRRDGLPSGPQAGARTLSNTEGDPQRYGRDQLVPSQTFEPSRTVADSVAYQELDVSLDLQTKALWCFMRPMRVPSITPTILHDFLDLHARITSGSLQEAHGNAPLEYYMQGSRIPGIYNLGGDLAFMVECVRVGDHDALRKYAYDCVQVVFNIYTGFNRDVVSIAVIEGDALGGGFEAALCCNFIVAERRARFGFPEILFNCFPGMGAYSFLSRRIGPKLAADMMQNGKIYSAAEMYEMGIVNHLADDGCGKEAAVNYIKADAPTYEMRNTMCRVRQRVSPIQLDELRDITDLWVETTLRLSPSDISKMQRFVSAQQRRLMKATG
jgi:DSF synthase